MSDKRPKFCGHFGVPHCKTLIRAATADDLAELRASLVSELGRSKPRTRLVAALEERIAELRPKNKPGQGRKPEGRVRVQIKLLPERLAKLDGARGDLERSYFVEEMIENLPAKNNRK